MVIGAFGSVCLSRKPGQGLEVRGVPADGRGSRKSVQCEGSTFRLTTDMACSFWLVLASRAMMGGAINHTGTGRRVQGCPPSYSSSASTIWSCHSALQMPQADVVRDLQPPKLPTTTACVAGAWPWTPSSNYCKGDAAGFGSSRWTEAYFDVAVHHLISVHLV